MKTKIVLISVEHDDARKVCEDIEGKTFKTSGLLDYLDTLGATKRIVLDMSQFMDDVNDQELDVLDGYFISYINVI